MIGIRVPRLDRAGDANDRQRGDSKTDSKSVYSALLHDFLPLVRRDLTYPFDSLSLGCMYVFKNTNANDKSTVSRPSLKQIYPLDLFH